MLGYFRPHALFKVWLKDKLISFLSDFESQIRYYAVVLEKVYFLNLDCVFPLIKDFFSLTGRPSNQQPELFRAFVIMSHFADSITSFVTKLKAYPVLAIACGFEPNNVPGIGTFYDFIDRLWLKNEPAKVLREPKSKKTIKPKKGDKLPEKNPDLVANLVNKLLDNCSFEDAPELLFQQVFIECVVKPSINLGLCGDSVNLSFAADGAPLKTGASPYGKKVCDCKKQGIYRCSCQRMYTNPTANWGWDSYHEQWYFGHTLYCITDSNSKNDLPLLLYITQASRHDSVSFVYSFSKLIQLYPDFTFKSALLDSAHDAYAIYRLLNSYNIEPFIPLNVRGKKPILDPVTIDELGIPICLANLNMLRNGFDCKKQSVKWRCPMYKNQEACSKKPFCSPSDYGRVVHTKLCDDYRLFTKTQRGSKTWRKKYSRRTSVERTIKRILVDYRIESLLFRAEKRWFWAATLAAINQHLDAQVNFLGLTLFSELGLVPKSA